MAEKNESSLIGYDPLAWMLQKDEEQQVPTASVAIPGADQITDKRASTKTPDNQEIEDAGWQETAQETALESNDHSRPADTASIVLEPVLSIQNVGELHERLLLALEHSSKIEIDASAVTTADTATLQLLLILKRTAIKQHKEVVIDFPSERFIEATDLLGISEMLEVDQAVAGLF